MCSKTRETGSPYDQVNKVSGECNMFSKSATCDNPSLASLNSAELVNVHCLMSLALLLRNSSASRSEPRTAEYPADFISSGYALLKWFSQFRQKFKHDMS